MGQRFNHEPLGQGVNITFIWTGRQKNHMTCFIVIFALWSRTKPAMSPPMCACTQSGPIQCRGWKGLNTLSITHNCLPNQPAVLIATEVRPKHMKNPPTFAVAPLLPSWTPKHTERRVMSESPVGFPGRHSSQALLCGVWKLLWCKGSRPFYHPGPGPELENQKSRKLMQKQSLFLWAV